MDPHTLARHLIDLAAEAEPIEIDVQQFPLAELQDQGFAQEFGVRQRYRAPAEQMVGELQEALASVDWDPDIPNIEKTERDRWTFGTAMTIRGAPRTIHRGFLQPL